MKRKKYFSISEKRVVLRTLYLYQFKQGDKVKSAMKISTSGLWRSLKEAYVQFYGPVRKRRSIRKVVGQQTTLILAEGICILTKKKKVTTNPPDTLISQDFTSTVLSTNDLNTEMCLSGFLRHRYLPHLNEKNLVVELLHIFNTYLGSQGILPQNSNDIPDLLEMLGIIFHFRSTLQTLSVNKIQTLFCWAGGSVSF